MKIVYGITQKWRACLLAISLILTLFFLAQSSIAQLPPKFGPPLLDSWSFQDTNTWTDDNGDAPTSFTNITSSDLGDGLSLVVDTNIPAWLNFAIIGSGGWTNLTVDTGTITFWYAPADWSSGTNGGNGPGQWAQLIDVGEWTPDSSYGYWGLSIDPSGSNVWFLAQDGLGNTYSLFTPMSWTTNYFHFIAFTYSATNVSLYLDGQLATNDPGGLSIWPGPGVLSCGVYFGSDTNGDYQANGLFDTIQTYGTSLDSNTVQEVYNSQNIYVAINPNNTAMELSSAPSSPSTNSTAPPVITGSGYLQWDGVTNNCAYSTNPYTVWITNVAATVASGGTMNVTFSIDGGQSNYMYDVFATSAIEVPLTNAVWAWMGQGAACNTYTATNISSADAFLILGTPYDPDNNGLTAAYELLILHCNPNVDDQDGSGLSDGWQVLLGLNVLTNQVAQPGTRCNYSYTSAEWLDEITGIKTASIGLDPEGNVTSVSQ